MKSIRFKVMAWLLLILILLVACAPKAAPAPAPAPTAPSPTLKSAPAPGALAKEAWQEDWEKSVSAAKTEGKVVGYSSIGGEIRTALLKAFKEKYGIGLEIITGKGEEISERLLAERRAGLYLADVYVGGVTGAVTALKPGGHLDSLKAALILPEVYDPKMWWHSKGMPEDELLWVDKERRYIVTFLATPQSVLAVNTEQVKSDEVKSYRDLLNPKWKGKIVMNDPTLTGSGLVTLRTVGAKMGQDYLSQLAQQEPIIIRDQRLQSEWVARGKYSIAIGPKGETVEQMKRAGAPIAFILPAEGVSVTGSSGTLALINRAPHPNAARVFINWLLSKEGQWVFSQSGGYHSARLDVPTENLDPTAVRQPGVEYFYQYTEDFLLGQSDAIKRMKEIFGHLVK